MRCRLLTVSEGAALEALLAAEPLVADYAAHAADVLAEGNSEVWGCEYEGALAGAIVIALGPFDAEINSLIVADAYRRRGVGQQLVTQAIARSYALGKERLLLEVRESNVAALRLYQQQGFSLDGRRAQYYPPLAGQVAREAACLMSLSTV